MTMAHIDTLRRDDMILHAPSKVKKRKARTVYCALIDGNYGSHFHSKSRAARAVRLLKYWGSDAYLSSPVVL